MLSWLALFPVDRFDDWLRSGLRASIYLAGAAILTFILGKFFSRIGRLSSELIRERGGVYDAELEKQTNTIAGIARRVVFTAIWTLAIVLALRQLGLDVGPILAGAGVAGLAVGFAAQSVLKDWINGFFLLAEGRIRISDVVKIGDVSGVVEHVDLRTTVLRGYDGNVHVIANGNIQNFTNMTLGHSYATFDIAVDYDEDPERLADLFRDIGAELRQDSAFAPDVLDDIEVAGVDRFTEQGVVVKARIKTQPSRQWTIGRELNRRLRDACAARGINIATAQRAVQIFEKGYVNDLHPANPTGRS